MAQKTIKMKAALDAKTGVCLVKSLFTHPMEPGQRKDPATGQLLPAHYIREVVCELNGKPVFNAHWGIAVARDPYIAFELQGAKAGDRLSLRWTDNKDDSDSSEIVIS